MNTQIIEGAMIQVVIHYQNTDGVSRRYKTVYRKATRYQQIGKRETALIRVHGSDVWAERYPATVWTVQIPEAL